MSKLVRSSTDNPTVLAYLNSSCTLELLFTKLNIYVLYEIVYSCTQNQIKYLCLTSKLPYQILTQDHRLPQNHKWCDSSKNSEQCLYLQDQAHDKNQQQSSANENSFEYKASWEFGYPLNSLVFFAFLAGDGALGTANNFLQGKGSTLFNMGQNKDTLTSCNQFIHYIPEVGYLGMYLTHNLSNFPHCSLWPHQNFTYLVENELTAH